MCVCVFQGTSSKVKSASSTSMAVGKVNGHNHGNDNPNNNNNDNDFYNIQSGIIALFVEGFVVVFVAVVILSLNIIDVLGMVIGVILFAVLVMSLTIFLRERTSE